MCWYYRLTVELPREFDLMTADAWRDGRWCAINVQLLVQLVLIPQAVDERSIFGNLCVMLYNMVRVPPSSGRQIDEEEEADVRDVDKAISSSHEQTRSRQTTTSTVAHQHKRIRETTKSRLFIITQIYIVNIAIYFKDIL